LYRWGNNNCWHFNKVAFLCAKKRKPITVAKELVKPCALHYYQLLFDLRRGVQENFMKAQGVRVHRKVKNHWNKPTKQPHACFVSIFTRYGDCTRRAADEEVVVAARNANIHHFVESLSEVFLLLARSTSLISVDVHHFRC